MANLMSCAACGGQVADDAKTCPHCGTKSFRAKRPSKVWKLLLVLFGVFILAKIVGVPEHRQPAPVIDDFTRKWGEPPEVPEFWRESTTVGLALKSVLKDPDSLKISQMEGPFQSKDGWLVKITYRAKNSFGGYVLETKWAVVQHGDVVKFAEENAYRRR